MIIFEKYDLSRNLLKIDAVSAAAFASATAPEIDNYLSFTF